MTPLSPKPPDPDSAPDLKLQLQLDIYALQPHPPAQSTCLLPLLPD